ncbi:MAG: hypothetical protein ACOCQR_00725 [bacterium]
MVKKRIGFITDNKTPKLEMKESVGFIKHVKKTHEENVHSHRENDFHENLDNINFYRTEMNKSILDKMFFLDKIPKNTVIIDWGCADKKESKQAPCSALRRCGEELLSV